MATSTSAKSTTASSEKKPSTSAARKPAAPAAKTSAEVGAYGTPETVAGVQFVPVAFTASGLGRGDDNGDGAGWAVPVGAYVGKDGTLRFEPNLVSLLVVGIPFVWVAGRALSRVIKALKK